MSSPFSETLNPSTLIFGFISIYRLDYDAHSIHVKISKYLCFWKL